MTEECVEQQTSQEDVRTSSRGAAEQGRDYHSDDEDVMEESQKINRMFSDSLQAADQEQLDPSGRRKPQLVRSKTLDNCMLTQVQIDPESKIDRKKFHYSQISKSNCQYHKIFKEISKEEQLRQSYTCALQKDILYQGRMFVSDHWICFHSKVFGKDTKIAIPVMSITNIKKTKTAILLPNALVIATTNDRYLFVSFLSRDNTYKFLTSVCLHLEGRSPCNSPVPSSAKHSFRGQRSPLLTPFPMSNFVDLDVRQRRQELEENSSSDSPAPDYDKIADLPIPHFLDALKQKGNSSSPEQKHKVKKQHQNQQSGTKKPQNSLRSSSEVVFDSRVMKTVSLNTLLIIYMFLVCVLVLSSCYLAFRIVSLEQKLTTLGSISDFTHHECVGVCVCVCVFLEAVFFLGVLM